MNESTALIFLSNLLPAFVYPVGSTILMLVVGGLLLARQYRRCALALALLALSWLWFSSTPFVADWLIGGLERRFPPVDLSSTPTADVAIVLGGALAEPTPPRIEIELTNESSRILQAARLYRAGKVKSVLVVGGNLPWEPNADPEAEFMRQLLVEWGVPNQAIELGGRSRNTYENALEARKLRETTRFSSALLVTSATHMPRAMAVFQHAGIPVTASSVHVTVVDHPTTIFDFVPNVAALSKATTALKERIGILIYRCRGYL